MVIYVPHGHTACLFEPDVCLDCRRSNTQLTQWHESYFIIFCYVFFFWNFLVHILKMRGDSSFLSEPIYKFSRGSNNHFPQCISYIITVVKAVTVVSKGKLVCLAYNALLLGKLQVTYSKLNSPETKTTALAPADSICLPLNEVVLLN